MHPQLAQLSSASGIAIGIALCVGFFVGWLLTHGDKKAPPSHQPKILPVKPVADQHFIQQLQTQALSAERKHDEILQLLINLPDTINKIVAARSTEELSRTTMRAMMDLVQTQHGALFVFDPLQAQYTLQVYAGPRHPQTGIAFSPGEGLLGIMSEMVGVREAREIAHNTTPSTAADRLLQAQICVAMRHHEQSFAFAVFAQTQKTDAMTKRILQMVADIHAVSAEGVRALDYERLKADLDQLTGLYNRRYLDRRLVDELGRARNYNLPLSVFMIDVDNFKNYNDTNGHQAGDKCLQMVARITQSVTRSSDVVCRYGGEEFLVILLGADAKQAWYHADRIRQTIASTVFPHGEKQPLGCVSISGGVSSFPRDATDLASLVKAADAALYRAKENGRNQVLLANPPAQTTHSAA